MGTAGPEPPQHCVGLVLPACPQHPQPSFWGQKKVFPSRMGKHAFVYKGGKRGGSKLVVLFLKNMARLYVKDLVLGGMFWVMGDGLRSPQAVGAAPGWGQLPSWWLAPKSSPDRELSPCRSQAPSARGFSLLRAPKSQKFG